MDLRHLRYFLAVADEGHFGRAAERLHIVQPALSMQIRALEEDLGVTLLTRTTRRVELTEAGRLFRVEAERTLAQAEHARRTAQRAARGEVGRVRVGFSGNAALAGRLPEHIQSFHATRAMVSIELEEMPSADQIQAIVENRIDIGYCPDVGLPIPDTLSSEVVGAWPWVIGMALDHRLARLSDVRCRDLSGETFITYAANAGDRSQAELLRKALGGEPIIGHRVASTLTVLTMAAAGLGLVLVPQPIRDIHVPGLIYMPLADFEEQATLLLISRKDESNGPVIAFRGWSVETSRSPPSRT
ncbi:LysR substrate-binding domain-containing protein [Luteibacter sp. 3190]|uniref:LysR family transcriptional regulator n=1 Tax=Luteibacter sp. 3190 TaxID=2817736 RepID=UPI0028543295|nr:LysR substrate-binding domain-containing protein [Luteibacter sp. 3190]MDR6935830.1 DNA-binding transcriptional LysR family regulator [Luteibacter sp. 3190]